MAKQSLSPVDRGYRHSVSLGNAGEHLVMAHLLVRRFQAFWADRGNPAFDISVVDGKRHSLLRVKATSTESVVWSRKKSGVTFLDLRTQDDYVCIVDFRSGVETAPIYVVPTVEVQSAIDRGRKEWISGRKRDGSPRVDSSAQRLWLDENMRRAPYAGFQLIWKQYLGNWDQLRDLQRKSGTSAKLPS